MAALIAHAYANSCHRARAPFELRTQWFDLLNGDAFCDGRTVFIERNVGGHLVSPQFVELTIKQLVDQFHFPFSELGQICGSKCSSRTALLAHFPR